MAKLGSLIKVAAMAGPTVWKVVQAMGPTITKMRRDYPEAFAAVEKQVGRLAGSRSAGKGPEGLRRRINVLRDQTTYLAVSADGAAEVRRVEQWRRQLDKLEASLPLLAAMGKTAARREANRIGERIDALSAEVLNAYIEERRDDAELGR
ncbi:hypothetical protein MF406_07820 [Georgenia sp. TF02-10]|uniref:hypothetical protein n=1 Tax=Georgenia sp. TF02-10 TaxID=2917725 RepID=UPI001FA7A2CB|nr:hypothetical protein [Georgenia sp. TF02-10]UNX56103.1 hypothetical protein MF406_07820 [Georgenia sp. TF02-10]